jgi:hypothetical protein
LVRTPPDEFESEPNRRVPHFGDALGFTF